MSATSSEDPAPNDLYGILGVQKTATPSEIKKAYFKKAMTCHPDKCPNDSAATAKFQKLSRAHSVLSDPEKRSLFDEAGIVDDGDDGDVAGGGGVGEGAWEAYFRAMFPAVTLAKVEAFAAEYRGSEEERGHVLDAYAEGNGDYDHVIDGVMCAVEEDRERFQAIVASAIAAGEQEPLGDDKERPKADGKAIATKGASGGGGGRKAAGKGPGKGRKKNAAAGSRSRGGEEREEAEVEEEEEEPAAAAAKAAKAKKRRARANKEAKEAEELLKEITARQQARLGGGGEGGGPMDLAALIRSRGDERQGNFDSWAAGLEAKYGGGSGGVGGTKKKKKRSGNGN